MINEWQIYITWRFGSLTCLIRQYIVKALRIVPVIPINVKTLPWNNQNVVIVHRQISFKLSDYIACLYCTEVTCVKEGFSSNKTHVNDSENACFVFTQTGAVLYIIYHTISVDCNLSPVYRIYWATRINTDVFILQRALVARTRRLCYNKNTN